MRVIIHILLTSIFLIFLLIPKVYGQDNSLVQIRTYDEDIELIPNIGLSINGGGFINSGEEGTVFVDIPIADLPPATIEIEDPDFETASWNYGSGRLEVIIRSRTHKFVEALVQEEGNSVRNALVRLVSNPAINTRTDATGNFQLRVPLDFDQNQGGSFQIDGYEIVEVLFDGLLGVINVRSIDSSDIEAGLTPEPTVIDQEFEYIDVNSLDTITSITEFYNFIRGAEYENIAPEQKALVDQKFMALLNQTEDSLRLNAGKELLKQITETSSVQEDILVLIDLAEREEMLLIQEKEDFDEKISIILEKLSNEGLDLTEEERANIMADLERLVRILESNEKRFFANQASYWSVLNSIEGLLIKDFGELEYRLVENEKLRQEEKEAFQQKLFITLGVMFILVVLMALSIYLARKFKKQEKRIGVAHAEVKRVNDHLEDLVEEKTLSLKETNRELDTFFYRSSHDLKRPLTSIKGLANVAELTLDKEAYSLFEKTLITATEMDKMLDKLTMISLINYPGELSNVNNKEILDNIWEKLKAIYCYNGSFDLAIQPGIEFVSHAEIVEMILFNLIENALKFSNLNKKDDPEISIEIVREGSELVYSIKDNGPGLIPEIQDKIWEMFFKGNDQVDGNGLGLYIAKKGAITLEGSIDLIASDPGSTEFRISIPDCKSELEGEVEELETVNGAELN